MLIIGEIEIKEVKFRKFFGSTKIVGKTLFINKKKFIKEALKENPMISSLEIKITKPGDKTRIIPVKDVIRPEVLTREGIGFSNRVKFDYLRVLDGVTVATCGQIVGYQEGIIDMSGPGAEYSSFSKMINIVLVPTVKKGISIYEHEKAIRDLGIWAAWDYLGNIIVEKNAEKIELFNPGGSPAYDLPKIAYVYMILAQGLLHDTYVKKENARLIAPRQISPSAVLKGAIISGNCVSACDKNTTFHHQNNPIIKELCRRHGKEINFVGIVINPEMTTFSEKQKCAELTAKEISYLNPDGVIISKEGFGNPDADLMMVCSKIEEMGIKTVCITDEYAGNDGASQSLADVNVLANAIVSTGNANEKIILPPMEKIIGDASILSNLAGGSQKSLLPDGSIEVELQIIIGATNQLGFEKLSVKEI